MFLNGILEKNLQKSTFILLWWGSKDNIAGINEGISFFQNINQKARFWG